MERAEVLKRAMARIVFISPLTVLSATCRQASRVATKMLSMTVQVEQLRITDNDAGLDDAIADAGSQVAC